MEYKKYYTIVNLKLNKIIYLYNNIYIIIIYF